MPDPLLGLSPEASKYLMLLTKRIVQLEVALAEIQSSTAAVDDNPRRTNTAQPNRAYL